LHGLLDILDPFDLLCRVFYTLCVFFCLIPLYLSNLMKDGSPPFLDFVHSSPTLLDDIYPLTNPSLSDCNASLPPAWSLFAFFCPCECVLIPRLFWVSCIEPRFLFSFSGSGMNDNHLRYRIDIDRDRKLGR